MTGQGPGQGLSTGTLAMATSYADIVLVAWGAEYEYRNRDLDQLGSIVYNIVGPHCGHRVWYRRYRLRLRLRLIDLDS